MTREEAIKNIKEHCYFANLLPQAKKALDMAIKALEQKPKTGHWEKTIDGHCYWYKCSCCGTKAPKNEWGNDYFSPYCPNCGAKMESEEKG